MVGVDRVKFYGVRDLAAGFQMKRIEAVLENNLENIGNSDINQIIELYNIKKYIDAGLSLPEWSAEQIDEYKSHSKKVIPRHIGRFFSTITDDNVISQFEKVEIGYHEDFWVLFQNQKMALKISGDVFKKLLANERAYLGHILLHRDIVATYGKEISDYMCAHIQCAELLMSEFLTKREGKNKLIFPDQLTINSKEKLLSEYIDSSEANPNYLWLIYQSESNPNLLPLSDKLKMKARHAYDAWTEAHFAKESGIEYGAIVSISDNADGMAYSFNDNTINFTFSKKWIDENMDNPTLLNNFIYLFGFVDLWFRCSFVSLPSDLGAIEKHLGIKGKKEYITGMVFRQKTMLTQLQMQAYQSYLQSKNVEIESIYKWFFESYLSNEFQVAGFLYDIPTTGASTIEKSRALVIGMDSVLKQYRMYCEDGCINRELFEMSSQHMFINDLPSMQRKKYVYALSDDIHTEIFLLYSDQAMLSYTEKTKSKYSTFFNLLQKEVMNVDDFASFQQPSIDFLIKRDVIQLDDKKNILINKTRAFILKELFQYDVICYSYCPKKVKSLIDRLVDSKDLCIKCTLFSKPEQQYLNYMLNKSEYSNGNDLRNKYTHGTNPHDENTIRNDYLSILKISALVIIKINEEFCLKYPISETEKANPRKA